MRALIEVKDYIEAFGEERIHPRRRSNIVRVMADRAVLSVGLDPGKRHALPEM